MNEVTIDDASVVEQTETVEPIPMEVYAQKAEKTGVYTGRFGGKSTQVCVAKVEYAGITFESVIWARLSTDRNNGAETITIEPGLPTGVKVEDEEFFERFKAVILSAVQVWFGYAAAERKAEERLLNPAAGTAGTTARVVKTVKRS